MNVGEKYDKEGIRLARLRALGVTKTEPIEKKISDGQNIAPNGLGVDITYTLHSDMIIKLKRIIISFDAPDDELSRWYLQGFNFRDTPSFGLKQSQGGPCGVLAAVQAEIFCFLYFGPNHPEGVSGLLEPSKDDRNKALAHAISRVLVRCAVENGGTIKFVRLLLCHHIGIVIVHFPGSS